VVWGRSTLLLASQLPHSFNFSLERLLATGKMEYISKKHNPDQGVSRKQVIHGNSLKKDSDGPTENVSCQNPDNQD
jgi:hypothetical protein